MAEPKKTEAKEPEKLGPPAPAQKEPEKPAEPPAVAQEAAEPIDLMEVAVSEGKALNVRKDPSAAAPVLTTLPNGELVRIEGEPEDGWQKVLIEAYVMADLLA